MIRDDVWPNVFGGVREADNGDKANLLGATVEESGLPRVRSGGSGGVPTEAPIEPAKSGTGGTGRVTPPPPGEAQT